MQVGVHFAHFGPPESESRLVERLTETARVADQGGAALVTAEVLRGHCDAVGSDYDAIEKTMILDADPRADVDRFLESMEEYAALGLTLVTLTPPPDDPIGWTTQVCEKLLPRLEEL